MNNNFNRDSLEEFFQNELHDDSINAIESDGWDMPSDQVWEGIETGLTIRKMGGNDHSRTWLSIAASFLLLAVCYQTISYQQNSKDLQQQVNILSDKVDQSIELAKMEVDHSLNQTPLINEGEEIEFSETATTKTNTIINNGNGAAINDAVPTNENNLFASNLSLVQKNNEQNKPTVNSDLVPINNFKNTPPLNISNNQLVAFDQNASQLVANGSAFMIKPVHVNKSPKRAFTGAYFGPSFVSNNLKGAQANELNSLMKQQEQSSISFQTGVKIGYQLSDKWTVETGLAYTNSKRQSKHNLRLGYASNNMSLNQQGNYEGTFVSNLSTAYGDIPVEIRLAHDADFDLEDGNMIAFHLDSEQELQLLQIPLSVGYTMGDGPLKVKLSGGAVANLITNNEIRLSPPGIDAPTPEFAELKHRGTQLKNGNEIKGMNKLICSMTAAVSLDYELTKDVHVYVEPAVAKSVTPIYENDEVEVDMMQASILLGVNYFF